MSKELLTGNEAVVKGCHEAGAFLMSGYPITPTTEIMEHWVDETLKNPNIKFLQAEDEMSAGFMMIGGILAGKKCFTATAGPGNVLMQDAFSMAENLRLPTVTFINQRGGPSTGTVIYSQQEVNLTCFGGNGEGLRIVYSVNSVQEMYDYAIKAFNTAWKYRFPTFVLADGYLAKTLTEIDVYKANEKQIDIIDASAYLQNDKRKPDTYTNMRNTYNLESELNEILEHNNKDYLSIAPEIVEYDDYHTLDADVIIFAHGIVSASAKKAVDELRSQGKKVGLFRPITLNPFPKDNACSVLQNKKMILIVESSLGQFMNIVKSNLYDCRVPIEAIKKPAMGISVEDIIKKSDEILNKLEDK